MRKEILLLLAMIILGSSPINAQWVEKSITVSGQNVTDLRAMYFINKDTGWVVGNANPSAQILKTTDGGNNWVSQNSNADENLFNVFFVNENIGFATGDNRPFLKTTDGGSNWTSVSITSGSNFRPSYLSNFYFVNDQIGFYTNDLAVFKTINSGNSWSPVLENPVTPITNISFNSDGIHGVVICFEGNVYKTSDAGETWQLVPSFTNEFLYSIETISNIFYIAGDGVFFKSDDFGDSWSAVPLPQPTPENGYISISFPSNDIGFCGGEPYKIFKTIDGGNNWELQVTLQEVYSPKVQMINETVGYVLADINTGKFYKTTNGGSNTTTAVSDVSSNIKITIYPNPANTHITIDYGEFASMSGYTLNIVNAMGQMVFTTPINQQTSLIDLSRSTESGIYFVQLVDQQNNTIENRKIVIQ